MSDKVVGLLGGMGPEATLDIFQKIVQATDAREDGDHLRIMIDNNPKIPSRQDAILRGSKCPILELKQTARNLENAGADLIIICANTAHYYYDDIQGAVNIEVLHIIQETVFELKNTMPTIKKVGVLATSGAMKVRIFHQHFKHEGIRVINFPEEKQHTIQEAIYSYKYNGLKNKDVFILSDAINYLIENGAEAIIMGCTEIPMMLKRTSISIPLIDPNEVIAKVAVRKAKGATLNE
ncbi:amino acid racemase [Bacillus timonensis]|nr:amino acid racemase [Bacillus timonensis]